MTNESANFVETLAGTAAIIHALAWPVVAALVLILYRTRIVTLLEVITNKIATATKVKAWQFEVETTEREITEVIQKAGEAGGGGIEKGKIPSNQLQAAQEVNKKLHDSQISERRAVGVVQSQIRSLVDEYERIRAEMPPGGLRTREMNEVAAKMRTLSLAARPLLRSLTAGRSAGERLAAICILQMVPELGFFHWLIERLNNEDQPFLLFQAAVAVLELVRAQMYSDGARIRDAIEGALQHVSSFKGGTPDQNTIMVLHEALSLVR